MQNKALKRRIIEISWKHKLSHLGSCLTAVDIIDEIYKIKKPDEKFILSAGHAGLALYCVIEKYEGINAEKIFEHHGVHPDKCNQCHLYCSTGSLGQGLPIAVGMALADRSKICYTLISDGEVAEGSIWEALRIADEAKLTNLRVYINVNGWGAYHKVDTELLYARLLGVDRESGRRMFENVNIEWRYTANNQFPFLKDLDAHYITLSEENYKLCQEILKVDL